MGKKAKQRKKQEREAQTRAEVAPESLSGVSSRPTARAASGRRPAGDGVSAAELATRWNSLAIHLLRRLGREDARLGLSAARLSALSVLVFGGPRTLGKLAEDEGVSAPSMTRLVTAMEAEGLVIREKHASDGRSVVIKASPQGEQLLVRGRDQRVEALAGWLDDLDGKGLQLLDDAATMLEGILRSDREARRSSSST
jgi:DNA-binding MarR family transcriptional regulator